ncbi:MAG: hypothetical protein ACXWIT_31425, partial [Burkholderiales bacterium]
MAQHDEEKMGEITGVQDVNELQAELARVKAENEELRRSQEEAGAQAAMEAGPSTWTRMRQPLAMVLIVLAVLAAPLAVTAVWIQTDVLSTDGWVATVGPLAKEPSIQTAVATYATDSLFKAVDVQVYVGQLLPDKAKVLAAPISTAVENFIAKQAQALTHSPRFANLWVQANRTGHAAIVRLLSGEGRLSPGPAGAVQLDLGPMIGQIVSKLQGTGLNVFQSLPVSTAGQFTLFQSDALAQF